MILGPIVRYDVVASTQDTARDLWDRGAAAGTVVSARTMTAGRGRRGRIWHVPPNSNVCLTVILPLPIESTRLWELSLVAGLAVAEAVAKVAPEAEPVIRFPNDIYVKGKKLAGILIETTGRWIEPGKGIVTLIGIGINVLTAYRPKEIAGRAVSLQEATGTAYSIQCMEEEVLQCLQGRIEEWIEDGFQPIVTAWRTHLDTSLERVFILEGESKWCRITDVRPDGTLIMVLPDNSIRTLAAVQVIYGDD